MMKSSLLAVLTAVASMASAGVVDFDFEGLSVGDLPGETLVLSSQGVDVTFTAPGLKIRDFGASFGGAGNVLSSLDDGGPITVVFSQAVNQVSFRNILNGDFGTEVDLINGWAYDIAGDLVDSFTESSASNPTLSGPGITSVVWGEAFEGQGFLVDGMAFQVPSPGAFAMLGIGGLVASRRRRV